MKWYSPFASLVIVMGRRLDTTMRRAFSPEAMAAAGGDAKGEMMVVRRREREEQTKVIKEEEERLSDLFKGVERLDGARAS